MEWEAIYFAKNGIIKSAFHKYKRPIYINEVYRIGLSLYTMYVYL